MSFQHPDDLEDALRSDGLSVRDLYTAWEQRLPVPESVATRGEAGAGAAGDAPRQIPWLQGDPALVGRFTARALEKEEFLLVCDAAREALRHWRGDHSPDERLTQARLEVRMDLAAALTRLGYTRDARRELEPMVAAEDGSGSRSRLTGRQRADVLLRLGDTLREEAGHLSAQAARRQTAEEALARYQQALALDPDRLEALVKVAAASLVLGEPGSPLRDRAHERARETLAHAARREVAHGPGFATTAARAVAHAVLGDTDRAAAAYGELAGRGGATTSRLADARHYAQFLAEALGQPRDFFKTAFPPLPLVVFAGHLPDRRPDATPGRAPLPPRFPPEAVEAVRAEIARQLAAVNARVGLVSAAAGSDLLFIEALRARGGHAHVILPWSREEFRRSSVEPFEPAGAGAVPFWEPRFERALAEAATVREIGHLYQPSSTAGGDYLLEVTAGLALDIARVSRLDVLPMALWDGQPGWVAGGTRGFVELWRHQLQHPPVVFNPLPAAVAALTPAGGDAPRHPAPHPGATSPRRARSERATLRQEVKSLLFADIVGYSKLREDVIPEFVGVFMERVSQLAATSPHAPHSLNTWGDAVKAVFDFAHDAGCFALQLTQMIQDGRKDWLAKGLYWEERGANPDDPPVRHPLNLRVGLHTGPVFIHHDPVVRQMGFTGTHVNRAARIEPVAPPGEVFASEEFAALAELGNEIGRRAHGPGTPAGGAGPDGQGFTCEYAGTMPLAKGYPGRFRIYRVLPRREFALEELARTVHARYCHEARARGETPENNPALRPWEELPEDLRQSNLGQVADLPHKLRTLGYELAPGPGLSPLDIAITPEQLETMAIREHDRWMAERQRHGWTYAPERDNARKHHPLIRPWEELSETERDKDREAVLNLPELIEQARFRVRKIG